MELELFAPYYFAGLLPSAPSEPAGLRQFLRAERGKSSHAVSPGPNGVTAAGGAQLGENMRQPELANLWL